MILAWLSRYAVALAAAFAVMAGWSALMQQKGVVKERSRVERTGKAIDAKAKSARKKAEVAVKAAPEPAAVLRPWCRDCD